MAQLLLQPITTDAKDPSETIGEARRLPSPWLVRFLMLAMAGLAAVAFGGWFFLIAAHARDRFLTDLPSTSWMTLSWYLKHGTLYPELFDGANYGGTRYMPLPMLVHTALSYCTGEFLESGKLFAYLSMLGTLGIMVAAMRSLSCNWIFAMALAASMLVAPAGHEAANSMHADILPVALQLAALYVISKKETRQAAIQAGMLSAAAVLCKSSAGWAIMAIGTALLIQNRRLFAMYVFSTIVSFAAVFGALHVLSNGRITENILTLTTVGVRHWSDILLWAPGRVFNNMQSGAPILLITLPLALASCAISLTTRRFNLYHFALPMAMIVTLVIYGDVGAGQNHILDLLALSLILTGDLWAAITDSPVARVFSPAQIITAMCVLWANAITIPQQFLGDTREAVKSVLTGKKNPQYSMEPLTGLVSAKDTILSEDPYIPMSLGQKPVVEDSFMMIGFEKTHPEWITKLAERIKNREFSKVILRSEPDPTSWWCQHVSFGPKLTRAIAQNYRLLERRNEFLVFAPADMQHLPFERE